MEIRFLLYRINPNKDVIFRMIWLSNLIVLLQQKLYIENEFKIRFKIQIRIMGKFPKKIDNLSAISTVV